jgi:catechol 2,3-dioxygenase-like lactoylglutathione lyase family enzyme
MTFESLDFIYMPSPDPPRDLDWFEKVLGAEVVFAIERFGTRVAMVRLGPGPAILLAGHLEGDPILVYRVESLDAATEALTAAGASVSGEFGIPPGEIREIEAPGGQRLAIYEETRPDRIANMTGRRDW